MRIEAGDHFQHTGKETDTWIIKALSMITPDEKGRSLGHPRTT